MSSFVSSIPDFSRNRIQTVKLLLEIPVILINVYLPASSLPQVDYEESLNLLSSAITRFASEAVVLVSGDFNRSLYRNNAGDIKFQNLCKTSGLTQAVGTSPMPSYHGYNGSSSKIDYVMLHTDSGRQFGVSEENLRIVFQVCKEENTDIISTHDAIIFEFDIPVNPVQKKTIPVIESVKIQSKKLVWEAADTDLYQQTLETLLEQNFTFWKQPECIQTLALLIPQAYIQAAEKAVPSKETKDIHFKTVKCERWRKAEIAAQKATKKSQHGCVRWALCDHLTSPCHVIIYPAASRVQ